FGDLRQSVALPCLSHSQFPYVARDRRLSHADAPLRQLATQLRLIRDRFRLKKIQYLATPVEFVHASLQRQNTRSALVVVSGARAGRSTHRAPWPAGMCSLLKSCHLIG